MAIQGSTGQRKLEIDILSLFPGYFQGPFNESILSRAQQQDVLTIRQHDIRAFADNKHHRVDERPYGGGPGMLLMPNPVAAAIRSVKRPDSHVIYLSPQGSLLTAQRCRELSAHPHLVLLCGHYEGIDARVIESEVDEVLSIGDYVLTNGCLAAIVLVDATVRFIPGVLGHELAADEDSFEKGLLDCPHYTRPEVFEGKPIPEVLKSGNHAKIAAWRHSAACALTQAVRPDLWEKFVKMKSASAEDLRSKPK